MVPFGSTLFSVSGSLRQAADEETEFTIANALSFTLAHTHTHTTSTLNQEPLLSFLLIPSLCISVKPKQTFLGSLL